MVALSPMAPSVWLSTLFTDTAAPMPTCAVLPTAEPSDLASLSVLPRAWMSSAPAVATVRPAPIVAEVCTSTTLTEAAAATDTLPSFDSAEGWSAAAASVADFCSALPTLFLACVCLPKFSWLAIFSFSVASSTFLPSAPVVPAWSSALPPLELAIDTVLVVEDDCAMNATSPRAAVMSRSVVARVTSLTSATAAAAPMAADSPLALPLAVVLVAVACCAETATLAAFASALPLPRRATVLLLTRPRATTGVMATPPAEPASAVVVVLCVAAASSVTWPGAVSCAPSCSSACTRLPSTLTATDAPMPTLPPAATLASCGVADAVASVWPLADSATAPCPASTLAPSCTSARLDVSTRFSASEPARPTALLPAPEVAFASVVCTRSDPSPAASLMPALRLSPLARMLAFRPTRASAAERTTFTATAAPMPTLVASSPLPPAMPSAVIRPSVLFVASSVSAPPDVTWTPSARRALAWEFCRLMPTAAATATLPSLVLAEALPAFWSATAASVEAFCSPSPMSLAVWFFLAKSSCLATLSSTLASSLLPASAFLCPPVALATTFTVLADAPWASNFTAPPASMTLPPVACTRSSTTATPTAAPMAALPPTALPLAVVVVTDFCWALTSRLPLSAAEAVPRCAEVVLLTTATAAAGVMATPPSTPASAVVVVL